MSLLQHRTTLELPYINSFGALWALMMNAVAFSLVQETIRNVHSKDNRPSGTGATGPIYGSETLS